MFEGKVKNVNRNPTAFFSCYKRRNQGEAKEAEASPPLARSKLRKKAVLFFYRFSAYNHIKIYYNTIITSQLSNFVACKFVKELNL